MRLTTMRAVLQSTALTGTLALAVGAAGAQELRTSIPADPGMIDPITYSELVAGDVLGNVYEGFVGLDADGNVVPALATGWEPLDGNLGFRFTLREGVTFHSGREFTAEDVKFTFEQLLIPGNRGGLNARYLDPIVGAQAVKDGETTDLEGVVVIDDHTVEVRFTEPDVLFPIYPFYFMDSGVIEEHGEDWFEEVSAGTGPFSFEAWNRGQEVVLSAHEDYWGGAPEIDGVRFLIVPSGDTAVSMYEAGELDLVYATDTAIRRVLRDDQFEGERITAPAAQIQYLGMNSTVYEPFEDPRVREALCLAIDREAIIQGIYEGAALPLYGQITPGVAGYNPDFPAMPYDPDRARQLMEEAGYPGGEGLPPVKMQTTEPNRNLNLYLASQFQEILGMPVEVEIVERGVLIPAMNAGEVALFHWGWSAGYPDALYFLSQVWYGPSPYNRARWQNDQYDALIEQAQATADEQERYSLYHQAEEILIGEFGTCGTTMRMQVALKKPYVEGVALTPFRFLPFGDVTVDR